MFCVIQGFVCGFKNTHFGYFKLCGCLSVCLWGIYPRVQVFPGCQRGWILLELTSQAVMSCLVWALETEHRPSNRVVESTPKSSAFSPAFICSSDPNTCCTVPQFADRSCSIFFFSKVVSSFPWVLCSLIPCLVLCILSKWALGSYDLVSD